MRLASEWVPGIKTGAIAADTPFVTEGLYECLPQGNAAIFHGVMGVHFKVSPAFQRQVDDRVLRKKRQHVVKKRDASLDF
jgi:hypothetical protein